MIYLANNTDPQEIMIPRSFGRVTDPHRKVYLTRDDIADNLETDDDKKVLAASQGVRLKEMIDEIDGVFRATYGTTTATEILAALNEKKLPIVTHGGRTYVFHSEENNTLYFVTILSEVSYWVSVDESDDSWNDHSTTLYHRPTNGIPSSDLAEAVQQALAKGDSAYQLPDGGIPESDLSNAVATKLNATEIFWATYGTTTAAEIDAAIAAGKVVAVKVAYSAGSNEHIHYLSQTLNSTRYEFFALDTIGGNYLYVVKCTKSDSAWNQGRVALQGTGELIDTLAHLIDNRTSTTKYPSAKATFDGLGQYGIVSQTQTWSGTGSNPRTYTMSNQVWGLIPQANIDLFVSAGATFNATTGYFELNGLTDISYEEMRAIYEAGTPKIASNAGTFCGSDIRTNLPLLSNATYNQMGTAAFQFFCYKSPLSAVILKVNRDNGADHLLSGNSMNYAFANCYNLRKIDGISMTSGISSQSFSDAFYRCYSLESIKLHRIGKDVSFPDSSLLDLASVVYMVNNAINTSAITITLHATAYARCQADTTEYTYGGNTYTGILNYASAKNITIVSA